VFLCAPEFRQWYWRISDLECNYCPDPRLHNNVPVLIDGESLNDIIQSNKILFIWTVLSGFMNEIQALPEALPYADETLMLIPTHWFLY
jgi:hypothetical protein